MSNSRRNFIRNAGLAGLGAYTIPNVVSAHNNLKTVQTKNDTKGLTILFQGDSITDGKRSRNKDWNHVMGHGYAYLVASRLWYDYPDKDLMFFNRGISGNRASDLKNRWQEDTIDLKPDIISILVGINDVEATIRNKDPEPIEKFEEHYRSILDKTKKELPDSQIILCEPFCLPVGRVAKKLEAYETELKKQQKIIKSLSREYKATFIELQKPFSDACKTKSASYWIWDGIHPMPAGHELIARQWIGHSLDLFI